MLEQTQALTPSTAAELESGAWRTAALEYPLGRGINFSVVVAALEPIVERLESVAYPLTLAPQEKWHRVEERLVGSVRCLIMDPDGYLLRLEAPLGERPFAP